MLKVVSENTIIADYAIYNKVNSIEELVALTKVKDISFMAFMKEDVVEGSELNEDCISMFRVEDFCCEEEVPYDISETLDRNTEIVSKWFIHCNKYGWVPFWENTLPLGSNMEITHLSRTTLRSDLYVGQTVWFAYANDIHKGEIVQVMLAKNGSECEKNAYNYVYLRALCSDGCGLSNELGQDLIRIKRYLHNKELFIDTLKHGYAVIKPTSVSESYLTQDKIEFIIRPLDKVFTESPF